MNTDTPRTDARQKLLQQHPDYIDADFARQLERELNEKEVMRSKYFEKMILANLERDQWKQCAEELAKAVQSGHHRLADNALARYNQLKGEK